MVISTMIHDTRVKIVDFSIISQFWTQLQICSHCPRSLVYCRLSVFDHRLVTSFSFSHLKIHLSCRMDNRAPTDHKFFIRLQQETYFKKYYLTKIIVSWCVKYFSTPIKFVWFPLSVINTLSGYIHFSNTMFLILLELTFIKASIAPS